MYLRISFTLWLLLLSNFTFSQAVAPSIQWQVQLGGLLDDIAYDITPTSDGGFIMTGGSTSTEFLKEEDSRHGGNYDYRFVKLDAVADTQWKKHLGGTGSDLSRRVFQTSDGGYILGGASNSNDIDVSGNHGDYDFWIVKLFSSGSVQWSKCYGGSDYDDFGSMRPTSDGGFILCGGAQSSDYDLTSNHGSSDFWMVKTDGSGNIQWQKNFGGSGYDKASDIEQCPDGGYILVGFSESTDGDVTGNHGDYDAWIVKTDGNGTMQWELSVGGNSDDDAQGVHVLGDGSAIISGYTYSNDGDVSGNHGDYDAWLMKISNSGSLVWSKCFGGSSIDQAAEVEAVADTGLIIACLSKSADGDVSANYGLWDFWLVKTDMDGNLEWQKNFGGSLNDVCYSAKSTNDGGFILGGYSESVNNDASGNHGKKDYWAVRLQGLVGIGDIPMEKDPLLIYPQPADQFFHAEIPSSLFSGKKNLSFQIFDVAGKLVKSIPHISTAELSFDCREWSGGMYFYKLKDEESVLAMGKLVIQ